MIKKLAVIVLVIVASLSVAGCTSSTTPSTGGATDYSDFYNKVWTDRVIENPFYKTASDRNNDLYVGEIHNASTQVTYTISFEHVKSQDEAAHVYKDTVAGAISDGYVSSRAFAKSGGYPTPVERWQGDRGFSYMLVKYYYYPEVNSWVVEKQVA